jgi:hypothetical protein
MFVDHVRMLCFAVVHFYAQTYVDYVCTTLAGQPLFQYINLQQKQYWEQLLYLDQSNFGGVLFPQEHPAAKGRALQSSKLDGDGTDDSDEDEYVPHCCRARICCVPMLL